MAARNTLEDVLMQMQNLKLSSPLRPEQITDENKENILEGQDSFKRKSLDGPIISLTSPLQSDPKSLIPDSESSVKENDATFDSDVNFDSHQPGLLLSNCEQKTSTQSLYDDCIDVIGKSEEQENSSSCVPNNASVNLNSTYSAEVQFESLQDLPLNQTQCLSEPHILNDSQVIAEADESIIEVFDLEEKLETFDSPEKECDHTLIENSHEENQTPNVEKTEETLNLSIPVIKSISSDSIEADTMEEITEKLQQEFSDTKLELNATQQAKALLEFEISKKDEIILKTEAEFMKKEQQYMQEIKALKEQLKEKEHEDNRVNEKDSKESLKELEEALREAKAKETEFMKVLEEYEKTIATRLADYIKLKEENGSLNKHLSNLELSFSDVHQKYEKAKQVIAVFKRNEEKLKEGFEKYDETFIVQEGRYESLKAHAQSQIDKCNVEISQYKEKCESEISKLKALVKRLEIKNVALETSLEQKTKECMALAALCDEVTGNKKY